VKAHAAAHNLTFVIAGPPAGMFAPGAGPAPQASRVEQLLEKVLDKLTTPPAAPVAPRDPLEDFSRMAKAFKELMPPPTAPSSMLETLDAMFSLQDRFSERLGPPEKTNGIASVLQETVKPMLGMLERKLVMDENNARRRRLPPAKHAPEAAAGGSAGATSAPGVGPGTPPADRVDANADPIVHFIAQVPMAARVYLGSLAETNADAAQSAETVLGGLSDDAYDVLAELIARPDFTEVLVNTVRKYQPHRDWFDRLVVAMRASIAAGDSEAPDAADGSGENTATHGIPEAGEHAA